MWRRMPKVTFIEFDDTVHTVEAEPGSTLMEAALQGAWVDRVGPKTDEEEDQLDTTFDVRPNSRLSCQIKITEALDGLVLRTPSYQGR